MTGAEHYAKAERLAEQSLNGDAGGITDEGRLFLAAVAQIHATLALAAAVERGTRYAIGMDTAGYGDPLPDPRWESPRCEETDRLGQRCVLNAQHSGWHSIPMSEVG